MADFILINEDQVIFDELFTLAKVTVKKGELKASGKAKVGDKAVCLKGDEGKISVGPCDYVMPPFMKEGKGMIKIQSLTNHVAGKTKDSGKEVLLKGSKFVAVFEVTVPAQLPPGTIPMQTDPAPKYIGSGSFETKNTKFKGT